MKRFLIPSLALISLVVILLAACGSPDFTSGESVVSQNVSDEAFAQPGAPGAAGQAENFIRRSLSKSGEPEPGFGGFPAPPAPAFGAFPAASATPAPPPFASAPRVGRDGSAAGLSQLQVTQRKVISTASITVEVKNVRPAITEVRSIAEGLGGFVEQLSSSGNADRQQASITIRVPQDQFFAALERIEALGEVQSQSLGSEDVSERFIDLEARLKSSLREELSLLKLLERANQVSEILTVERELARVRTEIERLQGQLNFLERRVDLATINISLFPPGDVVPEPPSASLSIETSGISGRVEEVKSLAASLGGEVDRVFISIREGRERANISLRVFPEDFAQTVEFLESLGDIRSKELQEGVSPADEEAKRPKKPNARIELSLVEKEPFNTGPIIIIAASVGGVILLALLGMGVLLAFRALRGGERRYGT